MTATNQGTPDREPAAGGADPERDAAEQAEQATAKAAKPKAAADSATAPAPASEPDGGSKPASGADGEAAKAEPESTAPAADATTAPKPATTGEAAPAKPARGRRRVRAVARVAGRVFGTVACGVAAVMIGLYVLPPFGSVPDEAASKAAAPTLPLPGGALPGDATPGSTPPAGTVPTPTPTDAPVDSTPQLQPGRPADSLGRWARNLSRIGIPAVALQAYGYAELVINRTQPQCHLSWTMLAGIGAVESNHGRHAGATLLADGTSQPKILGIPLDGSTTEHIADTDHGTLDGNPTVDQAMGPMQFIPSTWKRWAADADGDHKVDPYDIDDAALTAGLYLCADGRDLATGAGWWAAVLSYNHVTDYATRVYAETDRYGRQSLR